MKRIAFFTSLFVFFACATNSEMEEVNSRIDNLEQIAIATIDQQIAAINNSINGLQGTETELQSYIASLQSVSEQLDLSIKANAKDIDALEEELKSEINTATLVQLEELKTLQEELQGKLDAINTVLADLKERDTALENKITALDEYTNNELKKSKDWATATFSTLEQYNSTVEEIAAIKADIDAVKNSVNDLETILSEKLETAIAKTETDLKKWVNEQLAGYYTIAQIDAKVALLQKSIDDGDDALSVEINNLKTQLTEQASSITTAYQNAISEAISTNNGVIDGKIQAAITDVNSRITTEVATINQKLVVINNRLNGVEQSIAEILAMIQSVVVVPTYSDGAVALGEGETSIFFEVLPVEAAQKLESLALTAFSFKAVSTIQTKSDVDYITLPVKKVAYEDGLVKVTTTGKDINDRFFNGELALNARLAVTDGMNSVSSTYFGIKPQGDVDITSLRIAEYKNKIVETILMGGGNYIIRFIDGTSVELEQNSVAPRLFLDYDGYWSVSFDNGESSARIMNNNGDFISAGDLQGDNLLYVRFIDGNNNRYSYQSYYTTDPAVSIEEVGTPVVIDSNNSVYSVVDDNVNSRVVITTKDGHSFDFKRARIVPTGISTLTNKIKLARGCTVYVDFRVNASNASFNFDVNSSSCEIALDFLGEATKSSYVTTPSNYKLTNIEQVYDQFGAKKVGQYRAFITDLGVSTNYDELVALVLTINDGVGQTIQLSSSAIELVYSNELFTSFSILKANNNQVLGDSVASIDGNKITILTPYIFDASSLIPTFTTSGGKVFVDGELQESGVSAHDFTNPVIYTVDKNEYIVTLKRSGLPVIVIDTPNGEAITSKEDWLSNTAITIINNDGTIDYQNSKLSVRGRGNSTWGYPKKPYALKLEKKSSILGMPKHKRWVLLANWMDRTLLRNDVAFQISKQTGLSWTPRGRFVEVVLNGSHIGNYYLCEQIKVDENRVNINEMSSTDIAGDELKGGYLLELDTYYDEVNKFKSSTRNLPFMFKEPDEDVLQYEQFSYLQNYINEMESKMYAEDWLISHSYASYIDFDSFVDWWFVYELARNGEPGHPKSSYMYKDRLGPLCAGPVWDFDWGTFTPGSGFSIMHALYYLRLFLDPSFVSVVKTRWSLLKPRFDLIVEYIRDMAEIVRNSNEINTGIWPISSTVNGDEQSSFDDSIERMIAAYEDKLLWLDTQINRPEFPSPWL